MVLMLKFGGSSPGVMYIYDEKLSSIIELGESIMSAKNYSRDGGFLETFLLRINLYYS